MLDKHYIDILGQRICIVLLEFGRYNYYETMVFG